MVSRKRRRAALRVGILGSLLPGSLFLSASFLDVANTVITKQSSAFKQPGCERQQGDAAHFYLLLPHSCLPVPFQLYGCREGKHLFELFFRAICCSLNCTVSISRLDLLQRSGRVCWMMDGVGGGGGGWGSCFTF